MKTAIEHLGEAYVLKKVREIAKDMNIPKYLGLEIVCKAICNNSDLAGSKRTKSICNDDDAISQWVKRFYNDYLNRQSKRIGTPPQTQPDSIIDDIIKYSIPLITLEDVTKIMFAHRLSMSAENVLGPFLEEYIYERLKNHGWALAWGKTIKGVDLCSNDGRLIQIKNRSNTENSSSSKIRIGTDIIKWFRIDAQKGTYHWEELCDIANVRKDYLTEKDFRKYIQTALKSNPKILGIDQKNPWIIQY